MKSFDEMKKIFEDAGFEYKVRTSYENGELVHCLFEMNKGNFQINIVDTANHISFSHDTKDGNNLVMFTKREIIPLVELLKEIGWQNESNN